MKIIEMLKRLNSILRQEEAEIIKKINAAKKREKVITGDKAHFENKLSQFEYENTLEDIQATISETNVENLTSLDILSENKVLRGRFGNRINEFTEATVNYDYAERSSTLNGHKIGYRALEDKSTGYGIQEGFQDGEHIFTEISTPVSYTSVSKLLKYEKQSVISPSGLQTTQEVRNPQADTIFSYKYDTLSQRGSQHIETPIMDSKGTIIGKKDIFERIVDDYNTLSPDNVDKDVTVRDNSGNTFKVEVKGEPEKNIKYSVFKNGEPTMEMSQNEDGGFTLTKFHPLGPNSKGQYYIQTIEYSSDGFITDVYDNNCRLTEKEVEDFATKHVNELDDEMLFFDPERKGTAYGYGLNAIDAARSEGRNLAINTMGFLQIAGIPEQFARNMGVGINDRLTTRPKTLPEQQLSNESIEQLKSKTVDRPTAEHNKYEI